MSVEPKTEAVVEVDVFMTLPFYGEASDDLRTVADQSINVVRRLANSRIKQRAEDLLEKILQRPFADERAQQVLRTFLVAVQRLQKRPA